MKSDISLNEKQRTSSVLLHDFRLVLKQNAVMFLLGFIIFCVLFPVSTCAVPDTSVFNVDYTHQQLKFRFCADEVVPLDSGGSRSFRRGLRDAPFRFSHGSEQNLLLHVSGTEAEKTLRKPPGCQDFSSPRRVS